MQKHLDSPHTKERPLLHCDPVENSDAAAACAEVVTKLELLVTDWCDQAELILHDDPSDQLKNADGEVMGPRTELEHWHDRMAVNLTLTRTRTRTRTLA